MHVTGKRIAMNFIRLVDVFFHVTEGVVNVMRQVTVEI